VVAVSLVPPLTVSKQEIDQMIAILDGILVEVEV
jgi:4-aminobutyrate aminotransferase-like enzyme